MCLSASAATGARAFSDPTYFGKAPKEGGSSGRWFTGAPTDGYDCSVCHTGSKGEDLVVTGLPKNGYITDQDYQIRIAWPVTAARTHNLYRQDPPPPALPRAQLVAEFASEIVSQTESTSGSILQATLASLTDPETCASKQKRFGYSLYRQPHNKDPELVSACSTENLTRCLIAVKGCGSEEVRINWTAPSKNEGPIWFSVGFVATDAASSSPDGDQVSVVTIPIPPAGTEYQQQLGQSCAVAAPAAAGQDGAVAIGSFVFVVSMFGWRSRRRQRKGARPS